MNINDIVSVKLTSYGLDLLLRVDASGNYYKYNYDPGSMILKVFMWQLMNIFGIHISHSSKQVFENNEIII